MESAFSDAFSLGLHQTLNKFAKSKYRKKETNEEKEQRETR